MDYNQETSIERAVFERMTREKGTYSYEDIVRMTAEEIWNRAFTYKIEKGIECPMSDDYFYGFLAACKYLDERKKCIQENEKGIKSFEQITNISEKS
jgi:hypothetical protein